MFCYESCSWCVGLATRGNYGEMQKLGCIHGLKEPLVVETIQEVDCCGVHQHIHLAEAVRKCQRMQRMM